MAKQEIEGQAGKEGKKPVGRRKEGKKPEIFTIFSSYNSRITRLSLTDVEKNLRAWCSRKQLYKLHCRI